MAADMSAAVIRRDVESAVKRRVRDSDVHVPESSAQREREMLLLVDELLRHVATECSMTYAYVSVKFSKPTPSKSGAYDSDDSDDDSSDSSDDDVAGAGGGGSEHVSAALGEQYIFNLELRSVSATACTSVGKVRDDVKSHFDTVATAYAKKAGRSAKDALRSMRLRKVNVEFEAAKNNAYTTSLFFAPTAHTAAAAAAAASPPPPPSILASKKRAAPSDAAAGDSSAAAAASRSGKRVRFHEPCMSNEDVKRVADFYVKRPDFWRIFGL